MKFRCVVIEKEVIFLQIDLLNFRGEVANYVSWFSNNEKYYL